MAADIQGKPSWVLKEPSPKEINLLNQRVIQFTDIEDTFLDVWLDLENAGFDELAGKVLNAGLLFEHYLSQLPNDPTQRSPEQIAQLETYRSDSGTALDEGRAALAEMEKNGSEDTEMYKALYPTIVRTATLTGWSYLAFQEYLAINAGSTTSILIYGLCAAATLFLGLWFAHYKAKN